MHETKEQILLAALRLFARNGYEAVSVSDIASTLGLTKGALYRHYANKQAIFEAILHRMEQSDAEHAHQFGLPEGPLESGEDAYRTVNPEQMVSFAKAMFRYWTEEEYPSCFRRMLTLEQYQNAEMEKLYQQYLVSGPLGYVTDLFRSWNVPDAQNKAFAFYAPMFLLYSRYDAAEDKSSVIPLWENYVEAFCALWNKRGDA